MADFLRVAAKKSLTRGLVIHNSDTSAFRAVAGKKGTKSKSERREEKERERREKKERRRERKEKKLRKLQLQKNVSSSTEESPKVGRRLFPEKNGKEAPILSYNLVDHLLIYSCLTTWVTHFPKLSNPPNRSFLPIFLCLLHSLSLSNYEYTTSSHIWEADIIRG